MPSLDVVGSSSGLLGVVFSTCAGSLAVVGLVVVCVVGLVVRTVGGSVVTSVFCSVSGEGGWVVIGAVVTIVGSVGRAVGASMRKNRS